MERCRSKWGISAPRLMQVDRLWGRPGISAAQHKEKCHHKHSKISTGKTANQDYQRCYVWDFPIIFSSELVIFCVNI